jgi:probable rRNA maturation factor
MILLDPDLSPSMLPLKAAGAAAANQPRAHRLPTPVTLSRFLKLAQTAVRLKGQVNALFTTDPAIRRLNKQFRGKNKATDVLSFPAGGFGAEEMAGDLAISVPTALRQAVAQGHSLSTEVKVLMLHGLLHLSGLDHETDDGQMARREKLLRGRLGLPQGLIERVEEPTPAGRKPAANSGGPALKGHGLSRAAMSRQKAEALAAEGKFTAGKTLRQGLKPRTSVRSVSARLKSSPFKETNPPAAGSSRRSATTGARS